MTRLLVIPALLVAGLILWLFVDLSQRAVSTPPAYGMGYEQDVAVHNIHVFATAKKQELDQFYAEQTRKVRAASAARARSAPTRGSVTVVASGGLFDRLAQCESGGNPRAVSRAGRYRGAFQFDLDSYRRAGGSGDPINDSYEVQKQHAMRWQQLVGWGAWPVCSRKIGAR